MGYLFFAKILILVCQTSIPESLAATELPVYVAYETDSIKDSEDSLAHLRDSLILYARSYLGTPYKYGARGPDQFDCSGYTRHVFRFASHDLPVSSRTQIHVGEPVPLDSARRGDLIFFTSPRSGYQPGHVGIITKNDEEGILFIHSSTQRGVVEDKLTEYYRRRFLSIRQVLVN